MAVLSSNAVRAKKGDVLRPLENRRVWSLILVREGTAYCTTGSFECMLSTGSLLLFPPTHELCILPKDDYEHIFVEMSEPILPGENRFFCLNDDSRQIGSTILWAIGRLVRDQPRNYENILAGLIEAFRQFLLAQVDCGVETDLMKLEHLLRSNIANASFRVSDALKQIPQTPSYTRRLFSEAYGCSPRAYLTELRIGTAKMILMTQKLPIAEVADRCGFSDAKTFSQRFHQATGYTPSAFRVLPKNRQIETKISWLETETPLVD